ncbi:hypothetical protein JTE90_003457 [Oedothorax gibbosus]|uniref:BZIP domain-containing protein n=1 Tax=Oedothorax gibbosus TaxID=931172 RepID=A0AAV6U016_9ARAC|nr:hypothetical protein JTE90_003457 [Oedothorax gibbosus]
MKNLNFLVGPHCISAAQHTDKQRLMTASKRCKASSVEARRAKRQKALAANERERDKEVVYGPGLCTLLYSFMYDNIMVKT